MKKTLKNLASVILVAIIAMGMIVPAFAVDYKSAIDWTDEYGDTSTYYYATAKEVTVGANNLDYLDCVYSLTEVPDEELYAFRCYNIYYKFTVDKTGYYHFSTVDNVIGYGVPKSFDGQKAKGHVDYVFYGESDSLFYIEKGERILCALFPVTTNLQMSDTLNIEYVGDVITEYSVDSETLDDFIIGKDVWEEKTKDFGIATTCTVKFKNGASFVMEDIYLEGTCSSTPKAGKNTATLNLFGKKKNITFTAYYLKDLVKSVEVTNMDRYTEFITDYTGETRYEPLNVEDVTVNFKNGTSTTVTLSEGQGEVVLSNGSVADVYAGLSMNKDGSYDFVITVGNEVFKRTDVTVSEGTIIDNVSYLTEDNFDALSRVGSDIITGLSYIIVDPEFSTISFGLVIDDIAAIFANFMAFIGFYLSF